MAVAVRIGADWAEKEAEGGLAEEDDGRGTRLVLFLLGLSFLSSRFTSTLFRPFFETPCLFSGTFRLVFALIFREHFFFRVIFLEV